MADVVEQRERLKRARTCAVDAVDSAQALRQRQDAQRVLKARVDCAWKDEVVDTQLLAFAQLLEVRMVDDRQKLPDINGRSGWNADGFHGDYYLLISIPD